MRNTPITKHFKVLPTGLLLLGAFLSITPASANEPLTYRITEVQNGFRNSNTTYWGDALPNNPSTAQFPEERIQYLLDNLVYHSPLRGYDIRVTVEKNPELNARTDGQQIIVHSGLLQALGHDDNVMASILAHELGHILAGHNQERTSEAQNSVIMNTATSLFANYFNNSWGGLASQALQESQQIKNISYGREDEKEADAIGTILTITAGFDPHAMSRFFDLTKHPSPLKTQTLNQLPGLISNPQSFSQNAALFLLQNSKFYDSHPSNDSRTYWIELISARKIGLMQQQELMSKDRLLGEVYETLELKSPKGSK